MSTHFEEILLLFTITLILILLYLLYIRSVELKQCSLEKEHFKSRLIEHEKWKSVKDEFGLLLSKTKQEFQEEIYRSSTNTKNEILSEIRNLDMNGSSGFVSRFGSQDSLYSLGGYDGLRNRFRGNSREGSTPSESGHVSEINDERASENEDQSYFFQENQHTIRITTNTGNERLLSDALFIPQNPLLS